MSDESKTIESLKDLKDCFMMLAKALRESDPKESFRMYQCSEACEKAAEELERLKPVEAEMEGGGSTWWFVCGECHTAIDRSDRFCRQCGRRIEWDGMISGGARD